MQLTDFSTETYPTNLEFGDAAAINVHLAAEEMLGVEFSYKIETEDLDGATDCIVNDVATGKEYVISAKKIVIAGGLGNRATQTLDIDKLPGIMTAEDVLRHFGDGDNPFPMDLFAGKDIAIKGGADTGKVIAELLVRLGPKEAYGRSSVQFGGPKSVTIYGADFADKAEFCEKTRPRYQPLASFIGNGAINGGLQIIPKKAKMGSIKLDGDRLSVRSVGFFETGTPKAADIVIDATQLVSETVKDLYRVYNEPTIVSAVLPEFGDSETPVARLFSGNIYVVGPAAGLSLTEVEKTTFADGIKENTAAAWAARRRVEAVAKIIANLV